VEARGPLAKHNLTCYNGRDTANKAKSILQEKIKMSLKFKDVLKARKEKQDRDSRPKVEWFSLKNGETKYIRFLQEFDTDARNYDSTFGTAVFLVEHVSPEDWGRKALCTIADEGRCFACEMDKEEPFHLLDELDGNGKQKKKWHPWAQRSNFYVYVVDNKGEVKVMSRSTDSKLFDALVDEIELNDDSLTDLTFKISKGPQNQNPWEIRSWKKEHFEIPDLPELIDLNTAVGYKVEYSEQRNFYLPGEKSTTATAPSVQKDTPKDIGENW
jgi:hypothetical protein